jgi:biopolymer transport protein ExbD
MVLLLAAMTLVVATACKGVRTSTPEPLPFPNVSLPSNFKNAEPSTLDKTSVVLSRLDSTHIWVGPNEFPENDAFDIIQNRINKAQQKIVYVRAADTLDYNAVVKAIFTARNADVGEFALLVRMANGPDRQFTIRVLPQPDPNKTLSERKNPSLVAVSLSADAKITLVKGGFEEAPASGGTKEDMGTPSDTSRLTQALTQTLGDRTDRKVIIKASRTPRYYDVVRIIDAVKGAGANPIVLQIDDLP